jgi:hypothetical protein
MSISRPRGKATASRLKLAVSAERLPVCQEWCEKKRDDEAAGDAEANGAPGDRQEERLPDRRVRLPGVEDDHEGADERQGGVRQHTAASRRGLRRVISQMTPAPTASALETIQAQRS